MTPYEKFVSLIFSEIFQYLKDDDDEGNKQMDYALMTCFYLLIKLNDDSSESLTYEDRVILDKLETLYNESGCELNIDYDFLENLDYTEILDSVKNDKDFISDEYLKTTRNFMRAFQKFITLRREEDTIENDENYLNFDEEKDLSEDELIKAITTTKFLHFISDLMFSCIKNKLQSSTEASQLVTKTFGLLIQEY